MSSLKNMSSDAVIAALEANGLTKLARIIYRSNGLLNTINNNQIEFIMAPTNEILDKMVATFGIEIVATANFEDIIRNHFATEFTTAKLEVRSINGQPIQLDRQSLANRKPGRGFKVGAIAILPINNILITGQQKALLTMTRDAGAFEKLNRSTFGAFIQTSQLKGKDLLSLCVSNAKINELCNAVDRNGKTIFDQLLLKEFGRQVAAGESAREIYRFHHSRPSYYLPVYLFRYLDAAPKEVLMRYKVVQDGKEFIKLPWKMKQIVPALEMDYISGFFLLDYDGAVFFIDLDDANLENPIRLAIPGRVDRIRYRGHVENDRELYFSTHDQDTGITKYWTFIEAYKELQPGQEAANVVDQTFTQNITIFDGQYLINSRAVIAAVADGVRVPHFDIMDDRDTASVVYYPGGDVVAHLILAFTRLLPDGNREYHRIMLDPATFLPAGVKIAKSALTLLGHPNYAMIILGTDGIIRVMKLTIRRNGTIEFGEWLPIELAGIIDFTAYYMLGAVIEMVTNGGCVHTFKFEDGKMTGALKRLFCINGLLSIDAVDRVRFYKVYD